MRPNKIDYSLSLFAEWQFGSFLCKAIPYLQAVAVSASVNTLAAVALERWVHVFRISRISSVAQMSEQTSLSHGHRSAIANYMQQAAC